MSWIKSVDALAKGRVSQASRLRGFNAVSALTGWHESVVAEYTEGSGEAVARRTVWVFPNGFSLTLGTSIKPSIACLDAEIFEDAGSVLPFECMDENNWLWNYGLNGWQRLNDFSVAEAAEFIECLTAEAGVPFLGLPWQHVLDMIEDDCYQLEDLAEPGSENFEVYRAYIELMNCFMRSRIEGTQKLIPWEIRLGYEDDFLSPYCDYVKFMQFASYLSDEAGWSVILDEHCAACASGTRKAFAENNPDGMDKPEFLTWGQNSQFMYLPDGNISVLVNLYDEDEERFIKQHASDFGFDLGEWEDPGFEAEGELQFGDIW